MTRAMRVGRRPCGVLLKSLVFFASSLLASAIGLSFSFAKNHGGLAGRALRSREPSVARFSDLSPAAEASREMATEAIKAVPFTAAPGDLFGGAVQLLIIPFFIGVFIVYLVTVFKPEMILTDNQMVEYKKAEKQYFLEKRGAVKDPDAPAEMNRAQRRAARSLKGKRRVRSE